MSGRNSDADSIGGGDARNTTGQHRQSPINLHHRNDSSSSKTSTSSSTVRDLIMYTSYPVEPGHTLNTIVRLNANEWRPEMRANATYVREEGNAVIIINKSGDIMDYNKIQAGQKERQQPPSAKMSFKVFLINSETNKITLEHRTLRFWLDHSPLISQRASNNNNGNDDTDDNLKSTRSFANIKQESSQLAQAYFSQLIGSKLDDFPKNFVAFIMKLMRMLKSSQFSRIIKMEVELRQLPHEDHHGKPPSPVSSIDGSQSGESGRGSPLTSQKVLDIIESSYPNPISIREICSTSQTDETIVRQFVDELASKEKISSTDDGQHYTRTTKPIDTKVNMVKQMPKVTSSQQPVIAIITAQYCEKLAVDSMISDKETFVRYRVSSGQDNNNGTSNSYQPNSESLSANYVYTLGNIGDHRVVSTKLTSVGHSRGALIAAGNATTRLLGTFPGIEYVFLVGCGGGVANYTDFSSHVRLGDVVISHLPSSLMLANDDDDDVDQSNRQTTANLNETNISRHNYNKSSPSDFVYVHCRPKQQDNSGQRGAKQANPAAAGPGGLPVSYSVHKNLKSVAANGRGGGGGNNNNNNNQNQTTQDTPASEQQNKSMGQDADEPSTPTGKAATSKTTTSTTTTTAALTYDECHFRLWRPAKLDLQELAQRLWLQGLENAKHRIWEYYIDEGIKTLKQQDIEAIRPGQETDKLFMSIGLNDTIEVSHPEAADDEIDLRRDHGRPMCHFGPIGSGRPALASETLKQRMVADFELKAFDSEFDPVVESIYGNCKESYIMIRGIADYKDGRKKKDWQQYSALVAAAFMKSIIVNLKPLS